MMGKILRIVIVAVLAVFLLKFGDYTIESFKKEVHLKDPSNVLSPLLDYIPDLPETAPLDTTNSNSSNVLDSNINFPEVSIPDDDLYLNPDGTLKKPTNNKDSDSYTKFEFSFSRKIKFKIKDLEFELSTENTLSFLKWLNTNYSDKDKLTYEIEENSSTPQTDSNSSQIDSSQTEQDQIEPEYNDILESQEDLDVLIESINIVDTLDSKDDYNRNEYERPVKSYKLNNKKQNRNDYSWMTSPFLIQEEPFNYICPYTGNTVTDSSKLDYDHIVPLASTYIRGANKWTNEQKNEYAYNQWVGVDVWYSANRSKSDKGPAEWLPDYNIEDYCYSWILICSYYDLSMTEEELDICVDYIEEALETGETVEHLGGTLEMEEIN